MTQQPETLRARLELLEKECGHLRQNFKAPPSQSQSIAARPPEEQNNKGRAKELTKTALQSTGKLTAFSASHLSIAFVAATATVGYILTSPDAQFALFKLYLTFR